MVYDRATYSQAKKSKKYIYIYETEKHVEKM